MKIWGCKIGEVPENVVPRGADSPMRSAVTEEYRRLTGTAPEFLFSGWGSELTESERAVINDRLPVYEQQMVELHEASLIFYRRFLRCTRL